jgi:NAD(P)-dependent dehydrogenase (short-subunit alcohol dehydrogenase family)
MGKLDGKITIVTGATSGIGRRTVEIFVQEGAKVLATGRREELGRTLEAALGKDKCVFVKADATKEADVKAMIDACVKNGAGSTACSTMPAARRRWAASRPCRSRASMRRWRPWCARSCWA